MVLVDRARAIITSPAAVWPSIAAEREPIAPLFTSYVLPLAAIAPICGLIGNVVLLHRSVIIAIVTALIGFVLAIVGVAVLSLVAEALAPSFDGVKDRVRAFNWIGHAYTPSWVAGIALLVPLLGAFVVLIAGLYSLYVLYLGAAPMMAVPSQKAIGYTVVVIVAAIVVYAIVAAITTILIGILFAGALFSSGGYAH